MVRKTCAMNKLSGPEHRMPLQCELSGLAASRRCEPSFDWLLLVSCFFFDIFPSVLRHFLTNHSNDFDFLAGVFQLWCWDGHIKWLKKEFFVFLLVPTQEIWHTFGTIFGNL